MISFILWMFTLILFILSLEPTENEVLNYQFKIFFTVHTTILLIVFPFQFTISNVHFGMIWVVLPSTLVNINDIFAYFCGVLFGKTKLIKLSPNKTLEGFLGAAFFTIITGFIVTFF
jgi:phosphatidate cytidylyltransferase